MTSISLLYIVLIVYTPRIAVLTALSSSILDFPLMSGIQTRTAGRCAMGAASIHAAFTTTAAHNRPNNLLLEET